MLSTIAGVALALACALVAAVVGLRRSEERRQRESQRALGAAVAAETRRRMAAAEALGPRDRDDVLRELRGSGRI